MSLYYIISYHIIMYIAVYTQLSIITSQNEGPKVAACQLERATEQIIENCKLQSIHYRSIVICNLKIRETDNNDHHLQRML